MGFGFEQEADYGFTAPEVQVISLDGLFVVVLLFVLGVVMIGVALKLLRSWAVKRSFQEQAVYLVRLPKDKPGDQEKDLTVQRLREEIARGEIIFNAIGGLKPESGLRASLWGRQDHFAFEIVANHRLISFYFSSPRVMARYIEQQIHAHFPEAAIEEVPDFNIFRPLSAVAAGYLMTKRHGIFPLKTHQKLETDPMNSIINALSKIGPEEAITIQFTVRSADSGWHDRASEVPRLMRQGKGLSEAMKLTGWSSWFYGLSDLGGGGKKDKQKNIDPYPRMTAMEEEMCKAIEEKNAKAGLDVNIRVVVSAADQGRAGAYLNDVLSAFGLYNHYQYGNTLKATRTRSKDFISDYIYRRFDDSIAFLLNTEELTSLFHFPGRTVETPNVNWLTARHAPPPPNLPDSGVILGRNFYRGETTDIRIARDDRRRHMYIIGKSGTGKSQLMASLAIQDILNGEGVCVLDPHGDLVADVLSRIPPERAEDVVLFAPADIERPLALNLLEYDPRYPEQKTFVVNEMIKIFDKLYDLRSTGGPIFEQYMRNAMLLVMSDPASGSTLMEIPRVLSDSRFRNFKLSRCSDPTVVDFWRKEAEKAGGDAALANIVPYITSKLTTFISNDMMRPIIGQERSSFNIRDIMDRRKILLVDLSKGRVGEMNAFLLGMILVGKVLMAALSRADLPAGERKDFYFYIDEFQNFTTDSVATILSEARKYSLDLIMAHQYLGQLVKGQDESIRQAVFGNVGTWAVFKVGSEDAEKLVTEFSPVFNKYDFVNVERFTAYVKLLIENTAARPFSMSTIYPIPGESRPGLAEKIRALSRLKYGRDRQIVEAEIIDRIRQAEAVNDK